MAEIMFSLKNRSPRLWTLIASILFIFSGILAGVSSFSGGGNNIPVLNDGEEFVVFGGNTLICLSNPANPPLDVVRRLPVVVTAYSSTPEQTDDTPYVTAAGTFVREGIVANNYLSFGTKIRIPEIYDDKIFVVEDRMSWKKGNYHIDVWFSDHGEALVFGAKNTYIEILER
jgi:3D (Asp-Asp-Asp) domain-containing protein